MDKRRQFLCKSHPDFHLPADVEVGAGFDGEAYARRLKASGADAVAMFGKCHYGHCYYDTRLGHRHPRLRTDMLAEVVRGARQHDLGVVAYYSVFLDTAAIAAHPDWRLVAEHTKSDAGFDSGNFQPVCVNSPYLEELLIPQCVEMVSNYDVDELLLDTMTGFTPCYCDACRKGFGHDIPQSSSDPHWLPYVQWYSSCYERFYARATAAIHQANPRVAVTFNWEWGYKRPAPPAPHIGRLTADLISTGTVASLVCRYYAGTGLPFEYMTGRFMHGLGEWNSNTPESLLYTAAVTVANGGSFYIIDRQMPDGSLEDRAYEAMGQVFGDFLQPRRAWLTDAEHVPEVAVLHSYASVMGRDLRFFPDAKARAERLHPYEGVARLFMEHARHFTALNEERLAERLADYRVVIVSEQEYVADETWARLEQFVRDEGGKLIVTQSAWGAPVDERMLCLAGVAHEGQRALDYGYVGTTPPLLLRGRFARVRALPGTQVLYGHVPPLSAGEGGKKFGHGYAPATQTSDGPVITSRQFGRGEVVYVAMPFFKAYLDFQNPWQARLLLELLDRVLPDPLVKVTTAAQVELSVMRKGDDLIVHLVNHSGRERLGGYWYPVTEYIPEIRGIEVAIRMNNRARPVLSVPAGQTLATRETNGYMRFTLAPLHVMESVCVPGYFA